jgi:hypothetical protein
VARAHGRRHSAAEARDQIPLFFVAAAATVTGVLRPGCVGRSPPGRP